MDSFAQKYDLDVGITDVLKSKFKFSQIFKTNQPGVSCVHKNGTEYTIGTLENCGRITSIYIRMLENADKSNVIYRYGDPVAYFQQCPDCKKVYYKMI